MRSTLVAVLLGSLMFSSTPGFAQSATKDDDKEYDVTIVFIGLMSFDLGEMKPEDPVTIVIPNLTNGAKLQSGGAEIPKHVTYLLADRKDMPEYDPVNRDHDFEETKYPSDEFIYLPFNGFHVSIDDENDVAKLNAKLKYDDPKGCGECPIDSSGKDINGRLCWMSSMKDVKESEQKRDGDHFARHAASNLSPKKVAGRVVIRYGALNSYVVGFPKSKPEAVKFDFLRDDKTVIFTQVLAQETHWTFRARGVPFVLNLQSIKPGDKNERVAFNPKFPDPTKPGNLTIVIGNTTADEAGPMETAVTPKDDMHYAAYYRFIKGNSDGAGPLPRVHMVDGKPAKCDAFVKFPILQTLLAAQIGEEEVLRVDARLLAERKANAKNAKDAKSHRNMAEDLNGDGAPGGLNCSGNRWP
jgi:hypothetical protein